MQHVVLVIHLILALALVLLVLVQKSEGAGLVGPSASSMMPIRGNANILTRATGIIAACFFLTSITLAVLADHNRAAVSIADQIAVQEQQGQPPVSDAVPPPASAAAPAPAATPVPAPSVPAAPVTPPTAQ